MYGRMFDGLFTFIIVLVIVSVLGIVYAMYSFFKSDVYEVEKPITPELRLVVEDNVIDTVYVYKF